MKECSKCGEECSMPYTCNRCNKNFCSSHRLPENHNCVGLTRGGISGDAAIESTKNSKTEKIKNSKYNVSNKISNYIPDLVTYKFLIIIFVVYILQFITLLVGSPDIHNSIFVLSLDNIQYIWTWVISIFSHSPSSLYHILGNSIVLFFFGPILEKTIGSKKFTKLFIFSGIVAGLSQILVGYLMNTPTGVFGASGAILAILGVITMYNPKMKVYLYFMIPVPLWLLSAGYVIFSLSGILMTASSIAHGAHLVGLLIGVIYGYQNKDQVSFREQMKLS